MTEPRDTQPSDDLDLPTVEELGEVPGEKLEVLSLIVQQLEAYSGPLPHPSILREFESVVPTAAERILNQFEEQSGHRRDLERDTITSRNRRAEKGQLYAFILAGMVIVGGVGLLWSDKVIEGFVALVVALAPLFGAFVIGRSAERKERTEKAKVMADAAPTPQLLRVLRAALANAEHRANGEEE